MKKTKLYFKKLLDGHYPLEIEMEMINWFLKTGNQYDEYTSRWVRDGVSKHMFGYSANSHNANFPFPIVCENRIGNGSFSFKVLESFIQNCFFNAILKDAPLPVRKWRDAEKIDPDRCRVLQFNTEIPKGIHKYSTYHGLLSLKNLIGTDLKKEFFHPEYPDRVEPKIVNIILYTNGNGYVFEYIFSFSNYNYEPGWSKYIRQEEGESIPCFINRVFTEIEFLTETVTEIKY